MTRRPKFERNDIVECRVTHYRSARLGQQFRVVGTHQHEGQLVLDVEHPHYGQTAYLACNFNNLSREQPLFNQEEKMSIAKPYIALRSKAGVTPGVSALIEATQDGNTVFVGEQLTDIQRRISAAPEDTFIILQVVGVAEPERKPTHNVRML